MNSQNDFSDQLNNDHLVKALIELAAQLEKYDIPLIIGGG